MPHPGRRLVLLSGGIESTTALAHTLTAGHPVTALLCRYPDQPRREREAARTIAAHYGVALVEADLPWLHGPERDARGEGHVPHRNVVLYATAAHVASQVGAVALVGGHNKEDADGFPDAEPGFFAALAPVLAAGSIERRTLLVECPLIDATKADVVRAARRLGVPLDRTWSCYRDADTPCDVCVSCRERGVAMVAP